MMLCEGGFLNTQGWQDMFVRWNVWPLGRASHFHNLSWRLQVCRQGQNMNEVWHLMQEGFQLNKLQLSATLPNAISIECL